MFFFLSLSLFSFYLIFQIWFCDMLLLTFNFRMLDGPLLGFYLKILISKKKKKM